VTASSDEPEADAGDPPSGAEQPDTPLRAASPPPAAGPAPLVEAPAPVAPEPLPPELERAIDRDLRRGRFVVRLTWVTAVAHLVLGLVAIRQAVLLAGVDPRLVTTQDVRLAGSAFDWLRVVLVLATVAAVVGIVRWARAALPAFEELQRRGAIDGPPAGPGRGRLGVFWRGAGVPPGQVASWADLRVSASSRSARVAVGLVLLATAIGVATTLGKLVARDGPTAQAMDVLAGADGVLWLLGAVLVGAAFDQVRWREAVAARALGVFVPIVDAPGSPLLRLLPPALMFAAGVFVVVGRAEAPAIGCKPDTLVCQTLVVAADHDGGSDATVRIAYGIHAATSDRVGTLAIAVGGPGVSGLDEAAPILESLDPELVRRYDLLFWDARGVGASEGKDCPQSEYEYVFASPDPDNGRRFVDACFTEAGVAPANAVRYSTHQAAEDLEAIRNRLGLDRFALYGESYGTQLAQVYAAAHPDRLTALIIDGPVDLTRSANAFWADAATAFNEVLRATLQACVDDSGCHDDVADPAGAYNAILDRFAQPQEVEYGDPDGEVRSHTVDAAGIEDAVDTLLYDPAGRELVQRAVAAASHLDDVPIARLTDALGSSGDGPGSSSFTYHAVLCADYRVSPTANPSDVAAVMAYAKQAGIDRLRTDEVFWSQYPCLFWPYQPANGDRPQPLTATPFPVFVLAATDDPITPVGPAREIAGRLGDGYLVVTEGGPHVTFGRGERCVDEPVLGYLLEGRRPSERSIDCPGRLTEPYVPLTPSSAGGYRDALDAMVSTEDELFADPAYLFWDGTSELRLGCRHGGFIGISPTTPGNADVSFRDCAIVGALPLNGTGSFDSRAGRLQWTVTFPDGQLDYTETYANRHVTGTWYGADVDLSE